MKTDNKSTMIELVTELEKRNKEGKYDSIIAEAKAGEFHDFKNEKYDCGKVELNSQLSKFPELEDIRQDVMSGVYDEDADQDDKNRMIKDIRDNSPSVEAADSMIRTLGLDK